MQHTIEVEPALFRQLEKNAAKAGMQVSELAEWGLFIVAYAKDPRALVASVRVGASQELLRRDLLRRWAAEELERRKAERERGSTKKGKAAKGSK
jgi:hypothetical protein